MADKPKKTKPTKVAGYLWGGASTHTTGKKRKGVTVPGAKHRNA
jgi:hypothetical protein